MAITIKGEAELRRKLDKLKDLKSIVPSLEAAASHVKNSVSIYPPEGGQHRPQPFVSDKQRRYFFWALGKGIIDVPYRRGQSRQSERHQASWTIKGMKGGLQQIVGSDTTYGKLLQDEDSQTAYHKQTGWKTTQTVASEETDTVLKFIQSAVDKILAGR